MTTTTDPQPPATLPGRRWGPRGRRGLAVLVVAAVALLAAGALLVQAAGSRAAGPRTVVMTMRHTRFQPGEIRVEPGTTVRFVLRNVDPIDHEFIVGDEAVHQRHRVGRERHHHGEVPGEVSVAAGAEAATTFHFDRPGRVLFACHLPGHEAYGMVGTVEVG